MKTGPLRALFRGIYAYGREHPRARLHAALLVAGPGSALSHGTAAWMRRALVTAPEAIHVTSPRRHVTTQTGIVLHRAPLDPTDVERVEGLSLTRSVRTLHDLAATGDRATLAEAIDGAFARRLTTPDDLRRSLRPGRPGSVILRDALEDKPGLTRSEAERRLLALLRRAQLPAPRTNVRLHGYEVDAWWPRERLIVEVDGYAFHSGRAAFVRDRRRDAELLVLGYRTFRLTWRDLTDRPEWVAVRIAMLLQPVQPPVSPR